MNAIDDGNYDDCIRWSDDGMDFHVLDPILTENKLLAEVFNATKISSFIRKVSHYQLLIPMRNHDVI